MCGGSGGTRIKRKKSVIKRKKSVILEILPTLDVGSDYKPIIWNFYVFFEVYFLSESQMIQLVLSV